LPYVPLGISLPGTHCCSGSLNDSSLPVTAVLLLLLRVLLRVLLLSQWLHFCRSNPSGLMMPVDVQVALGDILNLAASWA
jgi:hypothetical protein